MNLVELVLRLAVAAAAAAVVVVALPASRTGNGNARLVVAGATGAACMELLIAVNVLAQSPVLWTFAVTVTPVAYLFLLIGLFRMLRPGRAEAVASPTAPRPSLDTAGGDASTRPPVVR
jgi:hypothetical protein